MAYTSTQLATAVLQRLGVLDATETAAATDITYITGVWAAKWEELSAHGMEVTYFSFDDIPNPVFLTIRDLVANEVRNEYGKPISSSDKEAEETVILRRLRRHVSAQASGRPVKAVYF